MSREEGLKKIDALSGLDPVSRSIASELLQRGCNPEDVVSHAQQVNEARKWLQGKLWIASALSGREQEVA